MRSKKRIFIAFSVVLFLFSSCASGPDKAEASPPDELSAAIRATSDYLNKQIPRGNKLVILNIQSEFPALSEYIIDELIANTVNDQVFFVVDRQQLDTIRAELDFQMSGEVDDDTVQALGRMAGAQTIISGAVSRVGGQYRLRVRALSVQSAQIVGQFNYNIPDGPTVAALAQSQATGYGGQPQTGGAAASGAGGGKAASSPAAAFAPGAGEINSSPVAVPAKQRPPAWVSEDDLVGVWKGSYTAGQGETALILTVDEEKGRYIALFEFFNLPGKSNAKSGKYYMSVSYNTANEKFYLKGIEWIERPVGYVFADLEGTITQNVFSGFLSGTNTTFRVVKQR